MFATVAKELFFFLGWQEKYFADKNAFQPKVAASFYSFIHIPLKWN